MKYTTTLLALTLAAAGCWLAGCSDEDGYDYTAVMAQNDAAILPPGVFDGEWTVNRQVVDTARLTVGSSLLVRLPEAYLTELCFSGEAPEAIVGNEPQSYILQQQGYSEQSQFMTLVTPTVALADGQQVFYLPCHFRTVVGGRGYSVSILSRENGLAVYSNETQLWTIGIPVNGFQVRSDEAAEPDIVWLPQTVSLYYNAKARIK